MATTALSLNPMLVDSFSKHTVKVTPTLCVVPHSTNVLVDTVTVIVSHGSGDVSASATGSFVKADGTPKANSASWHLAWGPDADAVCDAVLVHLGFKKSDPLGSL